MYDVSQTKDNAEVPAAGSINRRSDAEPLFRNRYAEVADEEKGRRLEKKPKTTHSQEDGIAPSTGTNLPCIGRREYVGLPDWGIPRLLAKIDTGARTTALHAEEIRPLGDGRVSFDLVVSRRNPGRRVTVVAPEVRSSSIRDSGGRSSHRPIVQGRVRLGVDEYDIEISLVDRKEMLCRMLLGRSALAGRFVVDVSRKHLVGLTKRNRTGP